MSREFSQWRGRDARTIKPREVIELLDGIVARGSPVMRTAAKWYRSPTGLCASSRRCRRSPTIRPGVLPGQEPGQFIDPKLLTRGLAKCADRFRKGGIGPFHLHDLRRTCRTGLARLKIPPHIAERVLNHAQERIAGTYDVYDYLEERRAALNAWAHRLQDIRAHWDSVRDIRLTTTRN
jgi:hypothetical protein